METTATVIQESLSAIRSQPALSRDEEHELARLARRGHREALRDLISAHMGVVVRVAQGYRSRGLPMEDLVEEGVLGLMEAVQRFDTGRKTKFITYAVWWVRRAMVKALAEGASLVRVPRYRSRQFKDARETASRLAVRLGRPPRSDELAEELGCGSQEAARRLRAYPRAVSIDNQDPERGPNRPYELPDTSSASQEETLLRGESIERLRAALASLPERERFVVENRFGIGNGRSQTLKELSRRMGVSKERVRQLEVQARKRLARNFG
jgi:RNA polymerase primary sigma factor